MDKFLLLKCFLVAYNYCIFVLIKVVGKEVEQTKVAIKRKRKSLPSFKSSQKKKARSLGSKDELAAIAHQYVEQQVFAVQERVGGYPGPTPQVGYSNLKI